jgi:hypothetical protein
VAPRHEVGLPWGSAPSSSVFAVTPGATST